MYLFAAEFEERKVGISGKGLKELQEEKLNFGQSDQNHLVDFRDIVGKGENACCQHSLFFPQ